MKPSILASLAARIITAYDASQAVGDKEVGDWPLGTGEAISVWQESEGRQGLFRLYGDERNGRVPYADAVIKWEAFRADPAKVLGDFLDGARERLGELRSETGR